MIFVVVLAILSLLKFTNLQPLYLLSLSLSLSLHARIYSSDFEANSIFSPVLTVFPLQSSRLHFDFPLQSFPLESILLLSPLRPLGVL